MLNLTVKKIEGLNHFFPLALEPSGDSLERLPRHLECSSLGTTGIRFSEKDALDLTKKETSIRTLQ